MATSTGLWHRWWRALVAEPLDELTVGELQERIVAVTPLVSQMQGWVQTAAERLDVLVAGTLPAPDGGKRTSAALRALPAVDKVLDGRLTPEQAGVLARLVGKIDLDALVESQPELVTIAAGMDPVQLGSWVAPLIATHCEPALDEAADRGRDERYLQTSRDADGCLRGRFVLTGEDSEAVLTALEPLATAGPGRCPQCRSAPRRRAGRGVRAGPAVRGAARRRRAPAAAELRPARRLGRRPVRLPRLRLPMRRAPAAELPRHRARLRPRPPR
jgi:hypothetical protein